MKSLLFFLFLIFSVVAPAMSGVSTSTLSKAEPVQASPAQESAIPAEKEPEVIAAPVEPPKPKYPDLSVPGLPQNSYTHLPLLYSTAEKYWPSAPSKAFMAGQIEKETCITLRHAKCWTPYAELKTSREWGRGFGQMTTAYRADGSVRFDALAETKALHRDLQAWDDKKDPYSAPYHMMAMVIKNKSLYGNTAKLFSTQKDALAGALSAYNGGYGGVLQDRTLCSNTPGCDRTRWFGHVENTSMKSKVAVQGYGQSWFAINRGYVKSVMVEKGERYLPVFGETSTY